MPFFQSVAVRLGVTNVLENMGVDKETAGWVAAGASLVTAVATADLHGHVAGEAIAQGAHHASGHLASHGASHAVASHASGHVASESTNQASNHIVSESTNQAGNHAANFTDGSDIQRSGSNPNAQAFHRGDIVSVNQSDEYPRFSNDPDGSKDFVGEYQKGIVKRAYNPQNSASSPGVHWDYEVGFTNDNRLVDWDHATKVVNLEQNQIQGDGTNVSNYKTT